MLKNEESGTPTDGEEVLVDDKDTDLDVEDTEESEEETEETEESEEETEEETEPETEEVNELEDEELDLDLEFLGKPTKVKKSEAKPLIQKGMNYDHVKEKADKAEQELAVLKAKLAEAELAQQKKDLEAKMLDAGYDADVMSEFINNHPSIKKAEEIVKNAEQEARKMERKIKLNDEKEALRSKPYFKELEKQIDEMTEKNPVLNVDTAYLFLLGKLMSSGKLDEITSTTSKSVKKSTIADLQDKAKRGKAIHSDGGSDEDLDLNKILSKEEIEMTQAFGNDIKNIAKYVKNKLKKG